MGWASCAGITQRLIIPAPQVDQRGQRPPPHTPSRPSMQTLATERMQERTSHTPAQASRAGTWPSQLVAQHPGHQTGLPGVRQSASRSSCRKLLHVAYYWNMTCTRQHQSPQHMLATCVHTSQASNCCWSADHMYCKQNGTACSKLVFCAAAALCAT
jgi:hypothetical protein